MTPRTVPQTRQHHDSPSLDAFLPPFRTRRFVSSQFGICKYAFITYLLFISHNLIVAAISELVRVWNFGVPESALSVPALVCSEHTNHSNPSMLVMVVPPKGQQNLNDTAIPCRWAIIPNPAYCKFHIFGILFMAII